jgi:putative oxidoreductase
VRYLDRLQPLALLVMRLALGAVMVGHGYHKVFGGLQHHAQFVHSLGLPAWTGYLSAFAEFFGGALVLIGLFTRAAAFAICINMAVAIARVHWHNGLTGDHGVEFPLSLATIAFALIFFGAGPIAIDHVLRGGGSVSSKK